MSSEDSMSIVTSKIKLLGQEYAGTPHCFPVGEYTKNVFDCGLDLFLQYILNPTLFFQIS